MENIRNSKIGELVAEDYRKANVFKKFGIDFCCGGGKSVSEVCVQKGIDEETLIAAIQSLDASGASTAQSFNEWELGFLVDYIINVHHKYVRDHIPLILEYAHKVAKVHGQANPEVVTIEKKFSELANELTSHLQKEEKILFPYIKNQSNKSAGNSSLQVNTLTSIVEPIKVMESEHEHAGKLLSELRELSNQYQPPEHACNTWKVLYSYLEEFENDLHQHVHLENNILFPKAQISNESIKSN